MKNIDLAKRVKELRKRKGISQELLSENSGISLRTIQRIENGETDPRGDTLKRLAIALSVTPDELIDWKVNEDRGFLTALNLSSLGFLLFPLLGILIPLIMWISKKDKLKDIDKVGKEVLNFQISWTIVVLLTYLYFIASMWYRFYQAKEISMALMGNPVIKYTVYASLYGFNFVYVVINSVIIYKGNSIRYIPKIKFLR